MERIKLWQLSVYTLFLCYLSSSLAQSNASQALETKDEVFKNWKQSIRDLITYKIVWKSGKYRGSLHDSMNKAVIYTRKIKNLDVKGHLETAILEVLAFSSTNDFKLANFLLDNAREKLKNSTEKSYQRWESDATYLNGFIKTEPEWENLPIVWEDRKGMQKRYEFFINAGIRLLQEKTKKIVLMNNKNQLGFYVLNTFFSSSLQKLLSVIFILDEACKKMGNHLHDLVEPSLETSKTYTDTRKLQMYKTWRESIEFLDKLVKNEPSFNDIYIMTERLYFKTAYRGNFNPVIDLVKRYTKVLKDLDVKKHLETEMLDILLFTSDNEFLSAIFLIDRATRKMENHVNELVLPFNIKPKRKTIIYETVKTSVKLLTDLLMKNKTDLGDEISSQIQLVKKIFRYLTAWM